METNAVRPTLIWAQRRDKVLLTIDVVDIRDEKVSIDEKSFHFSGVGGKEGIKYECQFDFRHEVVPQESRQSKTARNVHFVIKKKDSGPFWPTLATTKLHYLKVDFNKWKDEDESEEDEDAYEDGLENLMQRMDMGGASAAGLNGAGGFDPGADSDDSDDSDDEPVPGLS